MKNHVSFVLNFQDSFPFFSDVEDIYSKENYIYTNKKLSYHSYIFVKENCKRIHKGNIKYMKDRSSIRRNDIKNHKLIQKRNGL